MQLDSAMIRTRIDSVQVVQIRRESESFDRAFDVGFDVVSRVGDCPVLETGESTF